ncbi:DUF2894 domain-containing protein [Aromatoleum sp.]|uniref:DUF2894 domain-containing protein n=1 Tax=Aromatoleum sp. TaxID=2307007 RepID=UPI002FC5E432
MAPHASNDDLGAQIDSLRAGGAQRFDPVRFRFIEALARRAAGHRDRIRDVLDARLAQMLSEYRERADRAEREAGDRLARGMSRFPDAADALRQHCDAGDFRGLQRLLARLEAQRSSRFLADLLVEIAQRSSDSATADELPAAGLVVERRVELKSLKYFRRTWSKLSVDQQLSRAFAQAPDNAGPLNSHFLVLRALGTIRDIAPEYLEQFIPYVEALLWLDQADGARRQAQKNSARAEAGKKRSKAGRSDAG